MLVALTLRGHLEGNLPHGGLPLDDRQPPRLPQPPGERVLIRILPFRPSDCPILQPTDPDGTLLRRQVCICGKRGPWFLGTGRTTRHLNTVFEEFGNVRRSSRETLLPPAKLFVLFVFKIGLYFWLS